MNISKPMPLEFYLSKLDGDSKNSKNNKINSDFPLIGFAPAELFSDPFIDLSMKQDEVTEKSDFKVGLRFSIPFETEDIYKKKKLKKSNYAIEKNIKQRIIKTWYALKQTHRDSNSTKKYVASLNNDSTGLTTKAAFKLEMQIYTAKKRYLDLLTQYYENKNELYKLTNI